MKYSSIIGHDALKTVIREYRDGRYLFSGPPCGKRTVAFEMARYLLCHGAKDDGCTCSSCSIFYSGHPDFLCLGRNGRILVEDVEQLIDFVSRAPIMSETKVAVIDNAENISEEAANRILKMLEESSFTFILVTSDVGRILPTVRSRCVKVRFGPLNREDITNILWKIAGFDLPQARILGWVGSDSSVDVFSHAGQYLKCRDGAISLLSMLAAKNFLAVLEYIDCIAREDRECFLDMFILVLTDVLLLKNRQGVSVCPDRLAELEKPTEIMNDKALLMLINGLLRTKGRLKFNIMADSAVKTALMKVWPVLFDATMAH